MKKAVLIVLDSLGIGAMPDAGKYGDATSNTFGHIFDTMPNLEIPNLRKLGFGNIKGLEKYELTVEHPAASYGRMAELSNGKDTITGHWEFMGIRTKEPFRTYEKFPDTFIKEFEAAIGTGTLGNYAASGTVIIEDLGPEHERTGKPIVYTSADSVFQIAANVEIIPLMRLYQICEIARSMLVGDLAVGRVIARPYRIENGKRIRTSDRKDYAVSPPSDTVLDYLVKDGKDVVGIGKINDIFNGHGVSRSIHTDSNNDGVDKVVATIDEPFEGLIFCNLVDFDSKYGHRRDAKGYGKALEQFDRELPRIVGKLGPEDMLILCADHGNDPSHIGFDHTREFVPLIVYTKHGKNVDLGTRGSFADIGASIADFFSVGAPPLGENFIDEIR